MTDETVTPALTAEQWTALATGNDEGDVFCRADTIGVVMDSAYFIPLNDRHATAALCLHDQPFGFTRDDIKLLRVFAVAADVPMFQTRDLADLAARIAALLPPA